MKFPYLSTSLETDLLATFLLTPLWWLAGFNIFIYQLVAYFAFVKLFVFLIHSNRSLRVPASGFYLASFLSSYLISIVFNASQHPFQRVLSSLNHWFIFLMGFCLIVTICHLDLVKVFSGFSKVCWFLSTVTGLLGLGCLSLWCLGHRNVQFPALLALAFPSMLDYPFFYLFSLVQLTSTDWFLWGFPRLSLYSHVSTATGGFLLLILPLGLAYAKLKGHSVWIRYPFVIVSLTALVFSLSRGALCAFLAAFAFVWFLEKRHKPLLGAGILGLVFLAANRLYESSVWLFNIRQASTVGRLRIYSEALKIVLEENPLMGIGIRPREEFTMMAVGSHSTYVGILLISGLLGLFLFAAFQITIFLNWLGQKRWLKDKVQQVYWKYLGVSFVGATIWFLTDTLDTFPFVAYAYFIVIGLILLQGRHLRIENLNENETHAARP